MLRQWHAPSAVSLFTEGVQNEEDDVVLWDSTNDTAPIQAPTINMQLSSEQQAELRDVLQQFKDVLSATPGRTHTAECRIRTGTSPPLRLPPYRLPHAYCDILKTELEEMERDRISESSSSEEKGRCVTHVRRLSLTQRRSTGRRIPHAAGRLFIRERQVYYSI